MINTSLKVPAEIVFLEMVQNYVGTLSSLAKLSDKECLRLELATEEAFMNILEHAYPDTAQGNIFIKSKIDDNQLKISFQDEGLPFEFSLEESSHQISAPDKNLGFRLIHSAVDEARFENLGRQGKVLHLIKRLKEPLQPDMDMMGEKMESAPLQDYIIRPMREEEAIQVARLFWLAYGYSYKNENFYRPEGLIHLIGSGKVTSLVAVGEDGEVAGHMGLLREDDLPMAEKAVLVVAPAHRGRGIMELLHDAIESKAKDMGLLGVSIDPVTSHPISQKEAIRLGGVPCSLDLAACPPRQFKGLVNEEKPSQRESYLHCFNYFTTPENRLIHIPPHHKRIIKKIYKELGQEIIFGYYTPATTSGDYQINYDKTLQKGSIKVITANEDQWPEILRVSEDLIKFADADVVNLDLPLAQPASIRLCELAEEAGFIFSGLRPAEAKDGDNIRLQRIETPLNLDLLQLYPDLGKELLEHVSKDMEKKIAREF